MCWEILATMGVCLQTPKISIQEYNQKIEYCNTIRTKVNADQYVQCHLDADNQRKIRRSFQGNKRYYRFIIESHSCSNKKCIDDKYQKIVVDRIRK